MKTAGRPYVSIASAVVGLVLLFTALSDAEAQRFRRYYEPEPNEPIDSEFFFVRLQYSSSTRSRGGGAWLTDWPEAETHLLPGITRLTRVAAGSEGRIVNLSSDELMDYPWLYAVEVGQWYLDDMEAARLREYLDRGGFLMVDDFWGPREWSIFTESMLKVFPDRPIIELAEEHPLLHVLYDLDQRTQIPGRGGNRYGTTPHWRGIFDEQDRLLVAINFNMDMGDAWEHADDPWYPEPYTALAYRFAVNYLIYSMTH
ncbi:MAG: DUF4159 domain-containing protein [Candidatus Rariloculaceae bacterium]